MADAEKVDAVVIGANIRGLVATYVLSMLGYRAVLLERAPFIGGVDGSFNTPDGSWFEYGMHVLDYDRSEVATRLFTHVVDGKVHRVRLKRGIVLRNQVMPYAPEPAEMPEELRNMLPPGDLIDDIGDELPTRVRLSEFYGEEYANMIFDETLPSLPTENRHRAFGVDEAELLTNIYPWFFPQARRKPVSGDESRSYHDKLRNSVDQYILYPHDGGFGGFSKGFVSKFHPERIEVLTDARDMAIEAEPGSHRISAVSARGRRFEAKNYFWGASWAQLCGLLGIPCQNTATDLIMIGSFRLNRPANTAYNEILFGDPNLRLNRVYFPASFRNSDEPLLQIDYAIPCADKPSTDPDVWQRAWVEDLTTVGILDADHRVEMFDYKTNQMHFNSYGMEGKKLIDADPSLLRADSNVRPLTPSMANLNLNSHIPRNIAYVTSILATGSGND